jgi:hypothetical protein
VNKLKNEGAVREQEIASSAELKAVKKNHSPSDTLEIIAGVFKI